MTPTPRQRFSICGCASTNRFSSPCDVPLSAELRPIGKTASPDARGVFCFDNLRPGAYSIQLPEACGTDGCWKRPYEVTVEDRDLFAYVPLARTFPPTPRPTRSVTPTGTPSLIGRIRTQSGAVFGYTAHLNPGGKTVSVTPPETTFRFGDLQPGLYTVSINPPCTDHGCLPPVEVGVYRANTNMVLLPRTLTPTPNAEGCTYGLRSHYAQAHPCPSRPETNIKAVDVIAGGPDCCWSLAPWGGRFVDFYRPIERCGDWRIVVEVPRDDTSFIRQNHVLNLYTAERTPVSTFSISQERRCTRTLTRTKTRRPTTTPTRSPTETRTETPSRTPRNTKTRSRTPTATCTCIRPTRRPGGTGRATPSTARSGESVTLTATLSSSADPGTSTRWYTNYPGIGLQPVGSSSATFTAPVVKEVTDIEFYVEFCGRYQGPWVPPRWICTSTGVTVVVLPP